MDDLVNSSSFQKWTRGKASAKQKEYWDGWIQDDPGNRKLAHKAQQEIAGFAIQEDAEADVRQSWNTLDKKLCVASKPKHDIGVDRRKSSFMVWAVRIAASILLAATTGLSVYFYYPGETADEKQQFTQHEIETDYDQQKHISLSDGSSITLNAHSTLMYKVDSQNPDNVQVFLQGEAYFSVSKRNGSNPAPFSVRTASGKVQVLGTEFVVSTRNSKTRVVLEEGSVAVEPLMETTDQVLLKPGEMAEFDSSWDVVQTKEVNTKVYTSWKSRKLIFDETPLSEVIDRLEYTFGVHVIVRDPDLFTQRITGSVENTNLDVITSALSKTLDTTVRMDQNTVHFGN